MKKKINPHPPKLFKNPIDVDVDVYDIRINTDIIHGWSAVIREVYIPSEGIFFNSKGWGMIHIGRYDGAKKVGTTKVSDYIRDIAKSYVKAKDELKGIQERMDNWTKTKHLEKVVKK